MPASLMRWTEYHPRICSLAGFLRMQMKYRSTRAITKPGNDLHPQDADRYALYLSLEIGGPHVDIRVRFSPHLLDSSR